MVEKYIITGFVRGKGSRDVIIKPSSKKVALERKKKLEKELKISIAKFKWVNKLKIEKL